MHLVESYAVNCGGKVSRPFLLEKYFPLSLDKYITIHSTSKNSKTYDYWNDVIQLIKPLLNKAGIGIIQIGGKDDRPLGGVYNVSGQTTINQTAFIIKNSLLMLGVDSFPIHIASTFNIPIVSLYSNNWSHIVGPYWGDKSKQILLEPDRTNRRPSYSLEENPKTINEITPEQIAASVLKLLNIEFNYQFKTVKLGASYAQKMVESAVDCVIDLKSLNIPSIICRFDYNANEQILAQQLQVGRASIITDRPINLDLLRHFKDNIHELFYFVNRTNPPEFIGQTVNLGIKSHLLTRLSPEELNKRKLEFIDYGLIVPRLAQFNPENIGVPLDKLYYKSSKYTLSKGLIFPSKAAWTRGLSISSFETEPLPIINSPEFWDESEHFLFSVVD